MAASTGSRARVLITGFGPFPGVPTNVSCSLVRRLVFKARAVLPDLRFVAAVLPTEWMRAPQRVTQLHKLHEPVLALHLGVASRMRGFRIETEARNFRRMLPDAAGALPPSSRVCEEDIERRAAALDAPSIAAHLGRKGYCASLSNNAGDYLCNAVLYQSLIEAERRGSRCKVGFIHVPADLLPQDMLNIAIPGACEIVKIALMRSRPVSALTSA
jgi:pyroglutamyl-peptidase